MNKMEIIRQELDRINKSEISLLDLIVYDEIDCQLEEDLNNEELEKLFNKVRNTYLKGEESRLDSIVGFCIENIDELESLSSKEILQECFNY